MSEDIWKSRIEDGKEVLSIRPSLIASPGGKITTTYEIVGRTDLRTKSILAGDSRVTKIANIGSIEIEKPGLAKRTLGYGTLVFYTAGTGSDSRDKWEKIPHPEKVRDFIWSLREQHVQASPEGRQDSRGVHSAQSTSGATNQAQRRIGSKILLVPRLSAFFDEPLFRRTVSNFGVPERKFSDYAWIDRGDELWSYPIRTSPASRAVKRAAILSPVSGLLFDYSLLPYAVGSEDQFCLAILVADDGPRPMPASKVFGQVTGLCLEHGDVILADYWEQKGKAGSWQEALNAEIDRVNAAKCVTFDLKTDFSAFSRAWGRSEEAILELIRHLLAERSDLRDQLRFLDDVGSDVFGVGSADDEISNETYNQTRRADVREALDRFGLSTPISREDLKVRHRQILDNAPDAEVRQINADFEILLMVATG